MVDGEEVGVVGFDDVAGLEAEDAANTRLMRILADQIVARLLSASLGGLE